MSELISYRLRKMLQKAENPTEERDAYRRAYLDLRHSEPVVDDRPVISQGMCGNCTHLHPLGPDYGLCNRVVLDGHVSITHEVLQVAHSMSCASYAPKP